jgi:hypothetical protein
MPAPSKKMDGYQKSGLYWQGLEVSCGFESRELLPGFAKASNSKSWIWDCVLGGAVLDTAAGVWCDRRVVVTSPRTGRYSNDASGGDAASELTRRCRHAAAAVDDLIFVYGGLRGGMAGCHFLCLYCFLLLIKLWQIPDGPNNITSPHIVLKAVFERCCF